jgi:alpha-glucosidase
MDTPRTRGAPDFCGAILPIAPLTQSTNETPNGPLTLRVYAGDACVGHVYLDDGKTYAYKNGISLRMDFNCEVKANGLRLRLGEHKGSYPAWWQQIRIEIYGWSPRIHTARLDGGDIHLAIGPPSGGLALTVPDNGRGAVLELE